MMDSRTHRLAALTLAAVAMACARSRTNEVGISDSATATTAVRSDSTVVASTSRSDTIMRTDTMRRDSTTATDTTVRRDATTRADTARTTASGDVSLGTGTATDASVARLISTVDRAEIEEARLVLSKTQNSDLRTFAQKIIDDHTASLSMVDSASKSAMSTDTTKRDSAAAMSTTPGQGLDAAIGQVESRHARSMESLRGMRGKNFDAAYVQGQVDDHQKVLTLLRQFGNNVSGSGLKSHVSDYTTKVSEHLEQARTLQRTISSE
ncbi:MAG: DUF4142 domain-containing protein [Gemmatimonadaceae bacterium]